MGINAYKIYIKKCIEKGHFVMASVGYKKWKGERYGVGTNINTNDDAIR